MHRQLGCHSRTSGVKRKRQVLEAEDQENINTTKQLGHVEKKAMHKANSKHESADLPSSSLSSPLTPRDVFTDQFLNRILGEYTVPFQKSERNDPLPSLSWAKSEHLWSLMCLKDKEITSKRTRRMFEQNPGIKPTMRSILLDWITEVCEVYKMHRETYYLAVDYLDRYLSLQKGVVKSQLQLIGITCLFIASKVEEIYPPKLTEFAYVTDGACKADQILDMELVILKTLDWTLASVTVHAWLNLFSQICNSNQSTNVTNYSFVFPNHSVNEFLQSSQLLDLSILDAGSLDFSYSVLAASSIYLSSYKDQIFCASGLQWSDIAECVEWMSSFAQAIKDEKCPSSPIRIPNLSSEESYLIQTHSVDLNLLFEEPMKASMMLFASPSKYLSLRKLSRCFKARDKSPASKDKAHLKMQTKVTDVNTPAHKTIVLLTPPSSSKKPPSPGTEVSCG